VVCSAHWQGSIQSGAARDATLVGAKPRTPLDVLIDD
jgi:hypothetical protein